MRKIGLLLIVVLSISFAGYSQAPDISGVWIPVKLHWDHAPRSVDPHLSDSQVELLWFLSNGKLILMYCTIYRRMETWAVSAGDSEAVYSGSWKATGSTAEIAYRLIYRDVATTGDQSQAYGQHSGKVRIVNRDQIVLEGVRFRPEPRLEVSAKQQAGPFLNTNQ
jgi:hypothetical protein